MGSRCRRTAKGGWVKWVKKNKYEAKRKLRKQQKLSRRRNRRKK